MEKLVAAPEQRRDDGRAIILQADPACHDDRGGEDQFERREPLVLLPIIVVEEGATREVAARGARARGGDEGLAAGKPPFGTNLGPILASFGDHRFVSRARQRRSALAARGASRRGQA